MTTFLDSGVREDHIIYMFISLEYGNIIIKT